jgi:hypothetical protein
MKFIIFLAVSSVFILLTTLIFTKTQTLPKTSDFVNPLLNSTISTPVPTSTITPTPAPTEKQLPTFEKGLNIVFFESRQNTNYQDRVIGTFDEVKKLGITYVSLVFFFFQDDANSVEIYEDGRRTLTETEVRHIIRIAKAKNFEVQLRPFLGVKTSFSNPAEGVGRWNIKPRDSNLWFENYSSILKKYATIAQQEGIPTFGIGSEMKSTAANSAKWEEVIGQVREVYKGKIVYAANWDEFTNSGPFENDLGWLQDVDLIGIDAYFPLNVSQNPSISQLLDAWGKWNIIFERVKNSGKKVVISEIGITPNAYFTKPWLTSQEVTDLSAQEKYYKAAIEFLKSRISGIYFWAVDGYRTSDAGGFSPLGKPAEKVLADWVIN